MKYAAVFFLFLLVASATCPAFAQDNSGAGASDAGDPLWYNRASLFTPAAGTLIGTMILVIMTRAGLTSKPLRWIVVIVFALVIAGIQSFVLAPDPDPLIRLVIAAVNVILLIFALTGTNEFGAALGGRLRVTPPGSRWFESLF